MIMSGSAMTVFSASIETIAVMVMMTAQTGVTRATAVSISVVITTRGKI